MWLHIPNEGKRTPRQGRFLKQMGMVPGAPDFVFLWGDGSGAIELKTQKGRVRESQKDFEAACLRHGTRYRVCRSGEEVERVLREWALL